LRIKEIYERGRDYTFPRPGHCLKEGCRSNRIWGHGYVGVWFYGYKLPVYLRRWRCADCGCVYTIRPADCWPRHRTPIIIILRRLKHRLSEGVWDISHGVTRQAQGNWLRALNPSSAVQNLKVNYIGGLRFKSVDFLHYIFNYLGSVGQKYFHPLEQNLQLFWRSRYHS
jgi:hypothetical protein